MEIQGGEGELWTSATGVQGLAAMCGEEPDSRRDCPGGSAGVRQMRRTQGSWRWAQGSQCAAQVLWERRREGAEGRRHGRGATQAACGVGAMRMQSAQEGATQVRVEMAILVTKVEKTVC